jgi:hypothetical protein
MSWQFAGLMANNSNNDTCTAEHGGNFHLNNVLMFAGL